MSYVDKLREAIRRTLQESQRRERPQVALCAHINAFYETGRVVDGMRELHCDECGGAFFLPTPEKRAELDRIAKSMSDPYYPTDERGRYRYAGD